MLLGAIPALSGSSARSPVPVTAHLSKAFDDQVTHELVERFDQGDLTYRTELRTLNDTNFTRFEALLDSRFARADLQLERLLNERLGEFGQRSAEFERLVEKRVGDLEQRMEQRFAVFEQRIEKRFALGEQRLDQIRMAVLERRGVISIIPR